MKEFDELKKTIDKLRSKNGCPWDRVQTFESLKAKFVEEAYEVVDAVDNKDYKNLKEELGDLITLIMLYSKIAEEKGLFTISDVFSTLNEKLIRRHPHVFGDMTAKTAEEVVDIWNEAKEKESKKYNVDKYFSKIKNLSNLQIAEGLQNYAAKYNFDWDDYKGPLKKVKEEIGEIEEAILNSSDVEIEVGDLIFASVNLSRKLEINPELALHRTIMKVIKRLKYMEKYFESNKIPIEKASLKELDRLWEKSKEDDE